MAMRNRILAITRGSIPYVPELRPIAGSVTATILMQQLDYWFERHPDGFYKFQDASPDNPAYRPGDSWVEELDFSVAELRNAFDQIGHRHKSKTEWAESDDPFQGKFYCCYTDRRTRLTFYFRNHAMVDAALDTLVRQSQATPPTPSPTKPPIHTKTAGKTGQFRMHPGPFAGTEQTAFPGTGETQFTGTTGSSFTVNAQTAFTVNEVIRPPVNPSPSVTQIHKVHSLEVQEIHSAYTENTGLQKNTHRPLQQLPGSPSPQDSSGENRGGGGDVLMASQNLVYPTAEPIEVDMLRDLVASCRPENRQAVLDEVEGARQRGSLRSGIIPFARALVKAEADGLFTPSLSIAVLAARELRLKRQHELAGFACGPVESGDNQSSTHDWTEEELAYLPPKKRERVLAERGMGHDAGIAHH